MADITVYPGNVNWPTNWQGSHLTGTFIDFLGNPLSGSVLFTPAFASSPGAAISSAFKVIVMAATRSVDLDANGHFDIILPATDDPDVTPRGWTYTVTESFAGGRTYSIEAPANANRDLVDVAPVTFAGGTAITRGLPGMDVIQHGSDTSVPRTGAPLVLWVGSARPANALPYDQWQNA